MIIMKILVILFICCICIDAFIENVTDDNNDVTDVIVENIFNQLSDTISKNHYGGYIALVIYNGTVSIENKILNYIHTNSISKTVVLNFDDNNPSILQNQLKNGHYYLGYLRLMLMITNDCKDLINIIDRLKNSTFYRQRSKTLILLQNIPDEKDMNDVFKYFWKEKYTNIVILFIKNNELNKYTFNPFDESNFIKNLSDKSDIFYNKFNNVNGRNLNVLLLKYDDIAKILVKKSLNDYNWFGYEINFLKCLIQKLNGTIKVIPADFHLLPGERNPWRDTNKYFNAIGSKKRILNQLSIDILNSEEVIERQESKGVTENLYPYFMDNLVILMPSAPKIPYYLCLFMVFTTETWFTITITFILSVIGWCKIGTNLYSPWYNKLINFIRLETGGTLPKLPTILSERIYILFQLYKTLILITAFTSNLTTALMKDKYYRNYDTLEELDKAGFVLSGFRTQNEELRKAFNGTIRSDMFDKLVEIPDRYNNINSSLSNPLGLIYEYTREHPIFLNNLRASVAQRLKFKYGFLHIVKESPLPNFLAFKVPLGSPYLDNFNDIQTKIIESGLPNYWKKQHDHYLTLTGYFGSPESGRNKKTTINPISIYHIHASRLVIAVGMVSSIVVFIIEIFYYKYSTKTIWEIRPRRMCIIRRIRKKNDLAVES